MNAPSSPEATRRPLSEERIPDDVFAGMRRENLARWSTGSGVDFNEAVALQLALAWLSVVVWRDTGLDASTSGYASSVLGLLGFAGLLSFGAAGMILAASLWAFIRPHDPRGRGVALNGSLVNYTAAGTWLLVVAVVHLWPRIAG